MARLHIKFKFDLPSKIRLAEDSLEKAVLKENNRFIEISPPCSYVKSDLTQAQFVEVCIIQDADLNTTTFDEISSVCSGIAEQYFLKTRELIRLHTRQYDLGTPKSNGMKQNAVSIYDDKGKQLYFMNNISLSLRPEDKNIYSLDRETWNKIVEYLINDREPEIYLLLLLDGKYYASAGQVHEAIIMLAVGIEQFTVEYLKRDKHQEKSEMEFVDFFNDAVAKTKGESLKKDRQDDYYWTDPFQLDTNLKKVSIPDE